MSPIRDGDIWYFLFNMLCLFNESFPQFFLLVFFFMENSKAYDIVGDTIFTRY